LQYNKRKPLRIKINMVEGEMVYHFINMVFLGISIEGIACYRPIEVLEKRGLLSQVRWAGGAAAGAINPAPLFGLNFNSAELGQQVARSSLLKQMFQGFAKGKNNGYFN
jgi:hypothetical protein